MQWWLGLSADRSWEVNQVNLRIRTNKRRWCWLTSFEDKCKKNPKTFFLLRHGWDGRNLLISNKQKKSCLQNKTEKIRSDQSYFSIVLLLIGVLCHTTNFENSSNSFTKHFTFQFVFKLWWAYYIIHLLI